MMNEVWTVDRNSSECCEAIPVYIVSTQEEALRRIKILNERYAHGVKLNEDKTGIEDSEHNDTMIESGYPYLYYDLGSYYVDDKFWEDDNE